MMYGTKVTLRSDRCVRRVNLTRKQHIDKRAYRSLSTFCGGITANPGSANDVWAVGNSYTEFLVELGGLRPKCDEAFRGEEAQISSLEVLPQIRVSGTSSVVRLS